MTGGRVAGLLLAAGAGSRLGGPKALLTDDGGRPFTVRALQALADGGCSPLDVVVGARADDVRALVPAHVRVVLADGWEGGMGVSLRAGLNALSHGVPGGNPADAASVDAAVVMLVDTPGVTADVVRRVVSRATGRPRAGDSRAPLMSALSRASYHGVSGHPVLIGREHWVAVHTSARGDRGARDYLRTHHVDVVECADIGAGDDIDTQSALDDWRQRQREPRPPPAAGPGRGLPHCDRHASIGDA